MARHALYDPLEESMSTTNPSLTPTRKVLVGGVTAVLTALILAVLRRYEIEVDADLSTGLTAVLGALAAYVVPSPENRPPGSQT